jgi:hypothetical protein
LACCRSAMGSLSARKDSSKIPPLELACRLFSKFTADPSKSYSIIQRTVPASSSCLHKPHLPVLSSHIPDQRDVTEDKADKVFSTAQPGTQSRARLALQLLPATVILRSQDALGPFSAVVRWQKPAVAQQPVLSTLSALVRNLSSTAMPSSSRLSTCWKTSA